VISERLAELVELLSGVLLPLYGYGWGGEKITLSGLIREKEF